MGVYTLHEAQVVGDYWPLLPPGEYVVRFLHHETAIIFRTAKVYAHFEVVTPGPHHGARLFRAYRAHRLIGRPRKRGRFQLRAGSDLYRSICRLYPDQPRPDRVSLQALRNVLIRASVRTVASDSKQRPLPANLHYSVVDELLAIEAGAIQP